MDNSILHPSTSQGTGRKYTASSNLTVTSPWVFFCIAWQKRSAKNDNLTKNMMECWTCSSPSACTQSQETETASELQVPKTRSYTFRVHDVFFLYGLAMVVGEITKWWKYWTSRNPHVLYQVSLGNVKQHLQRVADDSWGHKKLR
jgi:hypothetical protein